MLYGVSWFVPVLYIYPYLWTLFPPNPAVSFSEDDRAAVRPGDAIFNEFSCVPHPSLDQHR